MTSFERRTRRGAGGDYGNQVMWVRDWDTAPKADLVSRFLREEIGAKLTES